MKSGECYEGQNVRGVLEYFRNRRDREEWRLENASWIGWIERHGE